MDWIAEKAAQTLTQAGRLTVVVQDNGSLHTSLLVRQQWSCWQEQGGASHFCKNTIEAVRNPYAAT